MIHFLIKTTEEYRFETLEDVENFHEQQQEDADEQDYRITSFSWTEKNIKESGEIVDSYFIVKVSKAFENAKDARRPLNGITYDRAEIPKF